MLRRINNLGNTSIARLEAWRTSGSSPNPFSFFVPDQQPREIIPDEETSYKLTNRERLYMARFPDDLIPAEFNCALLFTIMDNPVRLPVSDQVCDKAALLKALATKPENPFTRQPMPMIAEEIILQHEPELRTKIARYVIMVLEAIYAKHEELGTHPAQSELSRLDYETIHQSAMNRLASRPAPRL